MFTLQPQKVKVDKSGRTVKVSSRPYIRLKAEDRPAVFLQGGFIYTEDGKEFEDRPDWLVDGVKRLSDEALEEAGFDPANPVQKLNRSSANGKSK